MLVLEASPTPTEKKRYTARFRTVDTYRETLLLLRPDHLKDIYVYSQPRIGILPNVRYNPETRQERWSADAWARRTICDLEDYHILFTLSTDNRMFPTNKALFQNWFRPDIFHGDIYILKVSHTSIYDGSTVYEDILPNATPDDEKDFMETLERLFVMRTLL